MKILLKNAKLYTPEFQGINNILIENGRIKSFSTKVFDCNVDNIINCNGKIVCPMFVDGHEHIYGKVKNEYNYSYYKPDKIIESGIGTIVAVLANEEKNEDVEFLLKRVQDLKKSDLDVFCLAGSKNFIYDTSNYILNNKDVVGIKTALFQPQRAKPNLNFNKLKEDSISTFFAGKISNKKVQVHIHLDHPFSRLDKKIPSEKEINSGALDNLNWIDKIVDESEIPYSIFKLTHAQKFYNRMIEYANKGVYIDYTAFNGSYDNRFDCLVNAIKNGTVDLSKITISTDFGIDFFEKGVEGILNADSLINTIKKLVIEKGLDFDKVLPFVTTNVGTQIGLNVGKIAVGNSAKLLVLNDDLSIEQIINGKKIIQKSNNIVKNK